MLPTSVALAANILEGTIAGVHIGSAMMEHAARRLSAADWLASTQAKERVYGPVMPIYFGTTLLVALGAVPLLPFSMLQATAALCLVVAGVITATVNLPLNAAFKSWQPSTMPPDWQRLRSRWRGWNIARTFLAVVAFVCTSIGIVALS